ncbi:MAG: serine hydrolase domain-containing protein, partial [Pyrinomonadaceae bacterium]
FRGMKYAQTPSDLNKFWTGNTRMHVASVSKLLTSMALLKALSKKGISYQHRISDYLPAYWDQGPKIDQITFQDLLQHHSGFIVGKSATSYHTMKTVIQRGVNGSGSNAEYAYQNSNFGLMRIMIPILNGDLDRSAVFSADGIINDQIWDGLTIGFYHDYLQANVFDPAGVHNVGFIPLPAAADGAVAYRFPALNLHGWNSGDTSTVAGGAGWRLTLSELMKVVDQFRRRNTIVPSATAQMILDKKFGIDQNIETPLGRIYNKNGGWHHNGTTEQCVVYFMPDGIEVGVFVNSPLGAQNFSLRNAVKDNYLAAIKQ